MPKKKTQIRKSRRLACNMCGRVIQKKDISFARTFDGSAYYFDSDNCVLIFRKLREVYGKDFFEPAKP
jgi:YHS domain-containing protein